MYVSTNSFLLLLCLDAELIAALATYLSFLTKTLEDNL